MMLLKKRGFTLVELVACLGIMGLVSIMISGILSSGLRINSTVNKRTNVQSDIRNTMVTISDDIRKGVDFINDFTGPTATPKDSSTDLKSLLPDNTYIPVIYIKQVNGNMYLYAARRINNFYQLYKINLQYADPQISYSYDMGSIGNVDPYQVKYFHENYNVSNITGVSDLNSNYKQLNNSLTTTASISIYAFNDDIQTTKTVTLPFNFFYYQGEDVFRCVYYSDPDNSSLDGFRSIKLISNKRVIRTPDINSDYKLIVDDLSSIPLIVLQNDGKSYNLTVSASASSTAYNTTYNKTLSTSIALENYGGNSDD